MKLKRNSPLIEEAEPKAADFAKRYRVDEIMRARMKQAFLAGYIAGALRDERRAPRRRVSDSAAGGQS